MIQSLQNQTLGRITGGYLLQISVVFVAYLVAGRLGQATTNIRSSNLGPVWPAYGVALAAILLWGYRMWVGVAFGAFFVAFFSPVPHVAALGQAAGATVATTSGAFLLHRIANFQPSLSRLSDALSLIALGGFGSAIVSASIGVSALYATHVHAYSGLGAAWLIYWLGDATGVLLVTPLALRFTDFLTLRDRNRVAELAILVLLIAATCFVIFGDLRPVKLHVMAFAVLPFITWAAIRFGLGVTALSILIVAAIATIETALGSGPFASNTTFVNAVLLDVFFGVLSVSGLSLAAVIAERENAESEREQVVSKQAALEARHRADEALRESEERLRLAVQAGKMYAYDWDVATDAVVRSEESASILGSTGETSSITRQQLLARVHPDDRAKFIAAVDDLTPENPTTHLIYRMLRPDGGVIWLEKHGRAFFDPQGRMLRMIGMVADVTERRRAEERLLDYEKTVEGLEEMIAVVDREQRYVIANRQFLKMRNMTREHVLGRLVREVLNEGVFDAVVKAKLDECFQGNVVRYEMKYTYAELGERDLFVSYFPIEGPNGIDQVACILQDITDRKQAEQALAGMSRKLIEAQEQERTRIARELHDDVAQRLALLSTELDAVQQSLPDSTSELRTRLAALRKQSAQILTDIQAMSHELHSSRLEHLGIVGAMKGFCREFGEHQKVEIDFRSDLLTPLSPEISLCLFRVLQEALHNAAKHSGVRYFEVQLRADSGEIHLIITDSGRGFDFEAAMRGQGLGLISMRERVRLVNGMITIDSKPMRGTSIHVRVPLASEHAFQRAAG